ncbi:ABC transporter substrate-binding protein [Palleronia caenipelagi]|nr:ABC transporter substrate-binding protein [Palleronia caenipelagi]
MPQFFRRKSNNVKRPRRSPNFMVPRLYLVWILAVGLLICGPARGQAERLRILTSFSPEITSSFESLWAQEHSSIPTDILSKNTVSAIEEIQRGNARSFDLFWSSSPEAFVMLNRQGAFVAEDNCGPDGPVPVEVIAISSIGWAQRRDSMIMMPNTWDDLLHPIHRGKIAMARPARSGSVHFIIESLLQDRGWHAGWSYVLGLTGNLSTLTARSLGVIDGLANERFDIGITTDVLTRSRSSEILFRYGQPAYLMQAHIGILKGGQSVDAACEFVRMLLSQDDQSQLLKPNTTQIPIDASLRSIALSDDAPTTAEQIIEARIDFDAEVSADRYWIVNSIFDLAISDHLDQRRTQWQRYDRLKILLPEQDLTEIYNLLTDLPISERDAAETALRFRAGLRPDTTQSMTPTERLVLDSWRDRLITQLEATDAALSALEEDVPR